MELKQFGAPRRKMEKRSYGRLAGKQLPLQCVFVHVQELNISI